MNSTPLEAIQLLDRMKESTRQGHRLDTARLRTSPHVSAGQAPAPGPSGGHGPSASLALLPSDTEIELRVFVDRSVVEVFVNGRQCIAVRVYPERDDSVGVIMRSQVAPSRLLSFDAWQMQSIW